MIHKIDQTADDITVWSGRTTSRTYTFATLTGSTSVEKAANLTAQIQADLDVRVARNTLPDDDPDKNTDPAQRDLFWDGRDLVARSVLVSVAPNRGGYDLRFKSL